jgi:cytochrome P450
LLQTEIFSARVLMIPQPEFSRLWIPGQLDPPDNRPYRRLLQPIFTPTRVREMEDMVRDICRGLIDDLSAQDGCEFVQAFAGPLPSTLFARLCGLPEADAPWLRDVAYAMMGAADPKGQVAADAALTGYLRDLIEVRRKSEPTRDWVGIVLSARQEQDLELTTDDEVNMLQFLFLGGLITVTSMLTLAWWVLAGRPDLRRQIAKDSPFVPQLIEELLRINSNSSFGREVMEDVEFAGVSMRKGDVVMCSLMAANHDSSEFPRPDEIDLTREEGPHLAFGVGAHHCLGAGLARMEMRVALEEFHARIPDYSIEDIPLEWSSGQTFYLRALPLHWDTVHPPGVAER